MTTDETKLIKMAKEFVERDVTDPQSEIVCADFWEFAETFSNPPETAAGKAIMAYVKAEIATDYSMLASDEFEAMCKAVNAA